MHRSLMVVGLAAAAALAAGAASAQQSRPASQCFRSSDWRGWKATPDGQTMYIETGPNRVWKLDMAQACPELNDIDAKLVTRTATAWTCHPMDINLRVLRPSGFISHCQVRRMTQLTPVEAKALPRNLRP